MDETPPTARRARLGQNARALTTTVSVIVVAIALVLVGVTAFAVLGGFSPSAKPSCQPAGTPACDVFLNFHDVAHIENWRKATACAISSGMLST